MQKWVDKNYFWQIDFSASTFATVLYTSLIQKGRGLWPCEALATPHYTSVYEEGANSIPQ